MIPFSTLEVLADRVERSLPRWLRYDVVGDPASWVQHTGVCLLVTAAGALVGLVAGHGLLGAQVGAHGARAYYAVREALQAVGHYRDRDVAFEWRRQSNRALKVGWVPDGLLDFAGPLLVAIACDRIA